MKRIVPIVFGTLIAASGVFAQGGAAQNNDEIARALAAAPARNRDETTVVKWKPDYTYETLKKGTNKLVCYDRSGEPGRQPFAVQCTSLANLPRVAQNRKFEAIADRTERKKAIDAAEAGGTRVKPEFGSVWYMMNGPDEEHARMHITIAVPGATTQSTGLPDNPSQGGEWIMNAGTSTAHLMTPGH
ncbi:MAG: hypothetical protein ACRD30_10505 [Bryobacteraceae bacterium]